MAKITFLLLKLNGSSRNMLQMELIQDKLCPGAASAQPPWVRVTCHSLSGQLVRTGMDQAGDPAGASKAELETTPAQQLPYPPQEGEMPVEKCCFQMKKSPSKGLGKHLSDRQHGCFQQETAAKGCWIPLLLFRQWWEWGGHTPAPWGWEHPIPWCSEPRMLWLGTGSHCGQSRAGTRPLAPLPLAQPCPGE